MKALTIWQPWASLIMAGVKPYEFRGWAAPHALRGTRIAIHAGARPIRRNEVSGLIVRMSGSFAWTTCLKPEALQILERVHLGAAILPLSSILGTAILGTPVKSHEIVGEFGGVMNDSDREVHANWAWPLGDIDAFEPFVPARGAQGFWDWRP